MLQIGSNGDTVKVLRLFSIYLKDKAVKQLKNQSLFSQFQAMFHMYLNIGSDDDDDYDGGEHSDEDHYE